MEIKRILSTTVLALAMMFTSCGPKASVPVDKDDGHHAITVTNLADMEKDWMAGGSTRTIELTLKEDGVEKQAITEMTKGNLTFEIGDTSIASNSGFVFSALKVGKTTVAVKYGDSVKVVNLNIVEKPAEPAVITGKTVAQILEDVKTTGQTRLYELNGKVKNFATKTEWTQYGELNVIDDSGDDPVYIYGSYVNTEAEPAYFEWNGEQYTGAKYKTRNVLTNDMTKDLKKGDIVKLNVMYSTQYKNFYGIWLSRTDGPVVPATKVSLNKKNIDLEVGDSAKLTATIEPEDCNQKAVWTVENPSVEGCVTVNGGNVTAVKAGTATIKVTVGEKTATCAVTVTPARENVIKLTTTSLNLKNSYDKGEATVKGVKFSYTQLADYGDGIQMRIKKIDNVPSTEPDDTAKIWNTTAPTKNIASVTFKPNGAKMRNDNADAFDVEFSQNADFSGAQVLKLSIVGNSSDDITLTPTAAAKYVRIKLNLAYSFYFNAIEFNLAEQLLTKTLKAGSDPAFFVIYL